ncbi:MAG TPA: hypothetical protein VFR15_07040, partial [Chloroflexia bacterium]|nr:hypothetical protein [Chloroflexia bacterium]
MRAAVPPGAMVPWLPGEDSPAAAPQPDERGDLPEVLPGADLAPSRLSPRWLLLCFAATFILYVALVPRYLRYASPPTGDQPFYLMDTISLIQDGDLELANNYAQGDDIYFYTLAPKPPDFVGISAPDPLPAMLGATTARPESEWYGPHFPGLSILLVPAWIAGSWFLLWWPMTVIFMCLLGALVAANVFLLAHELTGKAWIAVVVWLAVAFTNPVMSYSYLIFTELPAGLLLIYAFRRLALGWAANGPWRLLLIGWCIAYIPWIAWRCVPVAAVLGLYALVQWWRHRRIAVASAALPSQAAHSYAGTERPVHFGHERVLSFALLAAPVVLSALLAAWYSLFLFGTVLPPGGGSLVRGQPALFNWPWDGLDALGKYLTGAFGLLFDRQMGLLVYAPFYLLAVVGAIAMFKLGRPSDRRVLLWIAALIFPYMGVVAAFEWWNGVWCPPARYWATFVPLLAAPVAMSLALVPGRLYKAIFALLALPGFALMAAMMDDPRRLFPGNREEMLVQFATDPALPVRIDLWNTLPYFTPPDAFTHPVSTGVLTFAALAIVLLCYVLIEKVRGTQFAPGWAPGAQMSVWLGVVALVGSGWFAMNLDHFRPKTLLAQVGQWGLEPPPTAARGIAYHQGKLYVPGYASRTLIALDVASGESAAIRPVSAGTPLTYTHPGAVAVGPDGLLYVLNNGDGPDALFAMRPDGEVVRRIPLGGKTNIAAGLAFSP